MLEVSSYYTHELERLWLSPDTPDDAKVLIHEELMLRETGAHQQPVSPAASEAEEQR